MHKEVSSVDGDHLFLAFLHTTFMLPKYNLVGARSRDAVARSQNPVRGNEGATTGMVEAPILLILKGDLPGFDLAATRETLGLRLVQMSTRQLAG